MIRPLSYAQPPQRKSSEEVKAELAQLGKITLGSDLVLRVRLEHCKKVSAGVAPVPSTKYIAVMDFDATCQQRPRPGTYGQEIIRFRVVLIDLEKGVKVDQFSEFIRPIRNPKLTQFCINYTGIQQETVDKAHNQTFPIVFHDFEAWMRDHGLTDGTDEPRNWTLVADGPTHMSFFLFANCKLHRILYPDWALEYAHMRRVYKALYMKGMMAKWGTLDDIMTHLGQPLNLPGGDVTGKIGRICLEMAQDGADFGATDEIYPGKVRAGFNPQYACAEGEIRARSAA